MENNQSVSPIQLNIDYPEKLSRLTTLFRFILIIPIFMVLFFITAGSVITHTPHLQQSAHAYTSDTPATDIITIDTSDYGSSHHIYHQVADLPFLAFFSTALGAVGSTTGGYLFLGPLLMLLFRKKYPKWWFNWNTQLISFVLRITAYFYFLTDEYPSTDEQQRIHVTIPYTEGKDLNRGLPLVKWFLAIPHYIILSVLGIIAMLLIGLSFIWVIITGRYPKAFFNYIVGVMRWNLRVMCYSFLLTTDKYPPFSLKP